MGYLGDVRLLESVHRRWTREVSGIAQLTYIERLKNLGLYSVYGRLVRAVLIKCWKIFYSERNIGMLNIFLLVVDRMTRGHSLKIGLPRCEQELKRFFHAQVIQRQNALPENVVMQASLVTFKRKFEAVLGSILYSVL